jgi:putative transport protein
MLTPIAHLLQARPLLLLFGVAALGYFAGRLRFFGFSLGVAAVLFAGVLVGWAVPGVALPDFVPELGLVLFVYTVGLASGPGFFASLRLRGVRDNLLALGALVLAFLTALATGRLLGLPAPILAGMFAGALNNTPALAAVGESLKRGGATQEALSTPVLAFSICYPLGVLIPLIVVAVSERVFRVSFASEPVPRGYAGQNEEPIVNVTARVLAAPSFSAKELRRTSHYTVNFSRVRRGPLTCVVGDETKFLPGDLVTIIGTKRDVLLAANALGHVSDEHLELDRSNVTYRRMFVSNSDVTERPLRDLHLMQSYGAVITRVRRGDVDLVPDGGFELMLGDRARVVTDREQVHELELLLGDSARRIAEVDVITFGLGIALGLLLGALELPLPGGGQFSLGIAGGPLVAGLILGRMGRTGPLVWSSPYGANLTLRQFGLVLFSAGVGIKAGSILGGTLSPGLIAQTALAGAAVTTLTLAAALFVAHRLLRIPLGVAVGLLAGIQTQPAVLAYALEKTGKELPNLGYSSVFPIAMIAKIMLAQLALQLGAWH